MHQETNALPLRRSRSTWDHHLNKLGWILHSKCYIPRFILENKSLKVTSMRLNSNVRFHVATTTFSVRGGLNCKLTAGIIATDSYKWNPLPSYQPLFLLIKINPHGCYLKFLHCLV